MSPAIIDKDGTLIRIPGTPKPPMTKELYDKKVAQLWYLEGRMLYLEDVLVSLSFLRRERDAYINSRCDGMPE